LSWWRQRDGFVNSGVLWSFRDEELVKPKAKKIAKIDINASGAQLADPKIEQSNVSQNPVEKFDGEGAID